MQNLETTGGSMHSLTVAESDAGMRLDQYITNEIADLSRSYVQAMIGDGHVRVDGVERKPSYKVSPGETISVSVPETTPMALEPEAIPLDILYEDDDIIVVNKPVGMVVHPAPGHPAGTLVNALLHHAPDISIAGSSRPGIVHRLDKDTSGVMVVARNDRASQELTAGWSSGRVQKRYTALVAGRVPEDEAVVDVPIARHRTDRKRMAVDRNGKPATTVATVTGRFRDTTLLDVDLRTGRTHQIRVHMAYIRHPIVGDQVYGNAESRAIAASLGARRQMLHASSLTIDLPGSGERRAFIAPIAPDMQEVLNQLVSDGG